MTARDTMKDPNKMGNWQTAYRIAQLIIIFNLIAFCTVMLIVDISLFTRPTVETPLPAKETPTFLDRADKEEQHVP